jgi:hypothetical protein
VLVGQEGGSVSWGGAGVVVGGSTGKKGDGPLLIFLDIESFLSVLTCGTLSTSANNLLFLPCQR